METRLLLFLRNGNEISVSTSSKTQKGQFFSQKRMPFFISFSMGTAQLPVSSARFDPARSKTRTTPRLTLELGFPKRLLTEPQRPLLPSLVRLSETSPAAGHLPRQRWSPAGMVSTSSTPFPIFSPLLETVAVEFE
jgi:hypothetical protein